MSFCLSSCAALPIPPFCRLIPSKCVDTFMVRTLTLRYGRGFFSLDADIVLTPDRVLVLVVVLDKFGG